MKIAIFGDSWSHRSFKKLDNFKEDFGTRNFQSMFADVGIQALNYSAPASSNQTILDVIKTTKLDDFDKLLVFQTDPLRNIIDRDKFIPTASTINHPNIVDIAEDILLKFYQQLGQLKQSVLLIGGLSCIAHHLVPDNIQTLRKSWTELADPDFVDCYFEWVEFTELVHDYVKCQYPLDQIKMKIQAKNYVWQNSKYFAWCHPSDQGYEIMFQELVQHLNKGTL